MKNPDYLDIRVFSATHQLFDIIHDLKSGMDEKSLKTVAFVLGAAAANASYGKEGGESNDLMRLSWAMADGYQKFKSSEESGRLNDIIKGGNDELH